VNRQRLVIALLVVGGALAVLVMSANSRRTTRPGDANAAPPNAAAASGAPTPPAKALPAPTTRPAPAPEAPKASAPPAAKTDGPAPLKQPAIRARRQRWQAVVHESKTVTIGSLEPASDYAFQLELTSQGAAVRSLKLSGHYATVADKLLAGRCADDGEYQAARAKDPDTYKGHYNLLRPVAYGGTGFLPYATRSITFKLSEQDRALTFPLDGRHWRLLPDKGRGKARKMSADSRTVRFAWTLKQNYNYDKPDADGDDFRPLLTLVKTYTVRTTDYSIAMSLEIHNHSDSPMSVAIDQYGPVGVPREDLRSDRRQAPFGKRKADGNQVAVSLALRQAKLPRMPYGRGPDENLRVGAGETAVWLGYTNKFFGSMMYLRPGEKGNPPTGKRHARFYAFATQADAASRTFVTGAKVGVKSEQFRRGRLVMVPGLTVAAGQKLALDFDIFAGPKKRSIFVDEDDPYYRPLYGQLNYLNTIDLGGCFCSSSWLAVAMMWLLGKLSLLALGNYGVAIILLVILVRVVLHPLTRKGQVSMMKMQKLAPMMQKIKTKYADDKEAQQREMMKFYKEHGAGGFLGCLPMLLQMPIWIALFTGLNALVDLRHAPFLPVWITDLAGPDALIRWSEPITIPLLSGMWGDVYSFNLLPILLCVAFFLQTKYNPQMSGQPAVATSPEQQTQKKMMQYMMPGMMLLFFYQAPSGLTMYIMTSTFVGLIEQYVIRKHIREKEAVEAATETTVQAPGKRSRSTRGKKPKGPFWVKRG